MELSMLHVGVLYPSDLARQLRMVHFETAVPYTKGRKIPKNLSNTVLARILS